MASWIPTELANTDGAWWDSAYATTDGTAINSIVDRFGNNHTLAGSTGNNRPSLIENELNGLPVMRFMSGLVQYLTCGTSLGKPSNWSIFAVAKPVNNSTYYMLGSYSSDGVARSSWGVWEQHHTSSPRSLRSYFGDDVDFRIYRTNNNTTLISGQWTLLADVYSGGPAGSVYKNGTQQPVINLVGSAVVTAGTPYAFSIGRAGERTTTPYNGDYAEVIVLRYAPSEEDRQKIEGYLAWKWGLQANLPVSHPYKDSAPQSASTTAYIESTLDDDIAGFSAEAFSEYAGSINTSLDDDIAYVNVLFDWASLIDPISTQIYYVCDVDNGVLPPVRVPISSWQATLRSGQSDFVQAVIPAATVLMNEIAMRPNAIFKISKGARFSNGTFSESVLAAAPLTTARMDEGATNATLTITGYKPSEPFAPGVRSLINVRSQSASPALRVRADIDWFLRPGQTAISRGVPFVVGYINYYANGGDEFMDVGEGL